MEDDTHEPIAYPSIHRARPPVQGLVLCDFRRPRRDWAASRLDLAIWQAGWTVLDAGCGPGAYVEAVRARVSPGGTVVGLDLSRARVAVSGADARVQGDVADLPFHNGSFDAALGMHVLYHVPDIPKALAELRRVVRPGGVLLVSTSAEGDEAEVRDLFLAAGGADPTVFGEGRFSAPGATGLLTEAFDQVQLHVEESELAVDDVLPVVNSFESQRYLLEPALRPGVTWERFQADLRVEARRRIGCAGSFRIRCRTAIYVCR